jgi:hypothetical protein
MTAQRGFERETTPPGNTPAANAWIPPQPRELPELRARLIEFTDTDVHLSSIAEVLNAGQASMLPMAAGYSDLFGLGTVAAPLLATLEIHRLRSARLFYASGDMTSLAVAAAKTPPIEPLSERRLPAESGLIVFAEPIGGYMTRLTGMATEGVLTRPELSVATPVVAASWSRWTPNDISLGRDDSLQWYANTDGTFRRVHSGFNGVWVSFYVAAHNRFGELSPDEPILRRVDGTIVTAGDLNTPHNMPELFLDREKVLGWGADLSQPAAPDTAAEWMQVLYTAWQLMTQRSGKTPLTETEEVQPNRARRRRDDREGITGPSGVRVVSLHTSHRPSTAAAEQDAARSSGRHAPNWSCRWGVGPHRRSQCLNPRGHADDNCEHEDRVIPFYIKGPADKPFRLPKTVHLWDSQPD